MAEHMLESYVLKEGYAKICSFETGTIMVLNKPTRQHQITKIFIRYFQGLLERKCGFV